MKKIGILLLTVLFCAGCRGGSGEEAAAFTEPISISEESLSTGSAAPVVTASAETEVVSTTAPEPSAEASSMASNSEEPDSSETQDDFSDIIEFMEHRSERFVQIAERAFHTEIKNDMEMEEIISHLMDRYIICANTYIVRTLFDWDFDERFEYRDHTYYKMQHRYFNTLSEMEDFVRGTFSHKRAESWISTSSSEYSSNIYVPRFIQKEDGIYFCIPDYVYIPPPGFLDYYSIEIKEQSETECMFSYNTKIDPKRYNRMLEEQGRITWSESDFFHEGKIVLEDGEWRIDSIFPAAF